MAFAATPGSGDLYLQRRIRAGEGGVPLLRFLSTTFTYYPIGHWLEKINCGAIAINGSSGDAGQILSDGDILSYQVTDFTEPEVPKFFEPIFKTDELLLVGKPAGIPVTRTGLIVRNTFINLLRSCHGSNLHPLHRLDRETSGLLLCASNEAACSKFLNSAVPLMTGKYYLALVFGSMPSGTIISEQPLAMRNESPVRCRMWPVSTGKPCRTSFHVLAANATFSLVLAELHSGRRHQIRAHLADLGHPIVGDKIYSHDGRYFLKRVSGELEEADYRDLGAHNQTLHAWALRLRPRDQQEQFYFSQLFSEDFQDYLKLFPNWEKLARNKLAEITGQPTNGDLESAV